MLFSEIHGAYFDAVSSILSAAVDGRLTQQKLLQIVQEKGFTESTLTIPQKLQSGDWPLLLDGYGTPLRHKPALPMTLLQKQWLKALLLDPRIRLFEVDATGLEDVKPLFTPDQFVYYDRYLDGDLYEDAGYIARFKTIREAIHTRRKIEITFDSAHGNHHVWETIPLRLEYSSVDDKFRVLVRYPARKISSVNLARITDVTLCGHWSRGSFSPPAIRKNMLVFDLMDERNALERAMHQFSYLTKETVRLDAKHYRVTLYYLQEDQTELLIKLLSFGPILRVISPDDMVKQIKDRIQRQVRCEFR